MLRNTIFQGCERYYPGINIYRMKFLFSVTILVLLNSFCLQAISQGYQALHGSAYSGSTAVFNNPASSVNSAYKWDLTLFSTQLKVSTNSPYMKMYSNGIQSELGLTMKEGTASRFAHGNFDVSLLNFLYKIDNRNAFNVGVRLRSYTHIKTMPLNYADTIASLNDFLIANANTPYLQGFITSTGWMETDLNYSRVLMENSYSKLSGGITLQIMKGLSGAFFKLNKMSYLEGKTATDTFFTFTGGGGSYAYSDNLNESTQKDFLNKSLNGLGLSLGIEYLTFNSESAANSGNNVLNYDWKIGVSLMDLGANHFKPTPYSIQFSDPNPLLPDANFDTKLSNASNVRDLSDSIKTLFSNNSDITDNFSISNPTRLILNIDKNLGNHFYVNGELSMNFYSTSSFTKLRTRELNLLTITPRWETIGWGAYLPIQYNTQGQIWLGMAVKAGPLVLGLHSLGILKKEPTINGGGYLMLSIHPFSKRRVLSKLDCPE